MMVNRYAAAVACVVCCTGSALAETVHADVWADNWFALYVGGVQVAQDSVSITTERSFNKESFSFSAERPFVLGFIAKDFKENDTGLEYIGSNRQQMGDGGLIAQFLSESGDVIAVTDADWRCMVTHEAPLSKTCERDRNPVAGQGNCGFSQTEEPAGWMELGFDDTQWSPAYEYTPQQVGPKDGYDQVTWAPQANLIWGPDLETSNTILCRLQVN